MGSQKLYSRAWKVFRDFYHQFVCPYSFQLPIPPTAIALFISYLRARKLAASTITSYLSAISYVHKMKELPDSTKTFLIQKLLTVVSKQRSPDTRLPITKPVLSQLVRSLQHTNSLAVQRTLFKAMFLTAFYGFFRIGELASKSPECGNAVVQFESLSFLSKDGCIQSLKITICHFKHNTNNRPVDIIITRDSASPLLPSTGDARVLQSKTFLTRSTFLLTQSSCYCHPVQRSTALLFIFLFSRFKPIQKSQLSHRCCLSCC